MLTPDKVKYIVVHCSATSPDTYVDARTIDRWHRMKGWLKIGYHFVITRLGDVQPGRTLTEVGAHVQGHNAESIGICMAGGVDAKGKAENNFTPAQWDALRKLVAEMRVKFPGAEVLGHRDLSPDLNHDGVIEASEYMKDCPSFDVRRWLKSEGI